MIYFTDKIKDLAILNCTMALPHVCHRLNRISPKHSSYNRITKTPLYYVRWKNDIKGYSHVFRCRTAMSSIIPQTQLYNGLENPEILDCVQTGWSRCSKYHLRLDSLNKTRYPTLLPHTNGLGLCIQPYTYIMVNSFDEQCASLAIQYGAAMRSVLTQNMLSGQNSSFS